MAGLGFLVALVIAPILWIGLLGDRSFNLVIDPDKVLVDQWLRENLPSGQWEEIKWCPTVELRGFKQKEGFDFLVNCEFFVDTWRDKLPEASQKRTANEWKQLWAQFEKAKLHRVCGIKYRSSHPLGGMAITVQTFEVDNGKVTPIPDNLVFQFPREFSRLNAGIEVWHNGHDVWQLISDPSIDKSYLHFGDEIEEKKKNVFSWQKAGDAPKGRNDFQRDNVDESVIESPPTTNAEENFEELRNKLGLKDDGPSTDQKMPDPADGRRQADRGKELPAAHQQIPEKILSYFQRADRVRDETKQKIEALIPVLKIDLRNAKGQDVVRLRTELKRAEKQLETLQKNDVTAYFDLETRLGDIGSIQSIHVDTVIDDHTALTTAKLSSNARTECKVLITNIETKKLKAGQTAVNTDLFKVVAINSARAPLKFDGRLKGYKVSGLSFIMEPINKRDIDKYREQYVAGKQTLSAP